MKDLIKIVGVVGLIFALASCTVHHHHGRRGLPPGQAKKVFGGSAKYYAPGQVKKRTYYYDDRGYGKHKGYKKHHKN